MKDVLYFLLFCVACYWLYGKCWGKDESEPKVLKQVTVTAKTANLRTGPGTNYDFAVNDSTGEKWQISRGTQLDVLAESKGWYKVRVAGSERVAYIKQTLCSGSGSSDSKPARKVKSRQTAPATSHDDGSGSTNQTTATPPPTVHKDASEEVVNERKSNRNDDEVLY